MSNLKIKTYTGGQYGAHVFFILSRGNNSGKPLNEPCPNCFICICSSAEEKEKAYWLFYALWQGKQCEELLVGSVIPFIRKNDLIGLVFLNYAVKATPVANYCIYEGYPDLENVQEVDLKNHLIDYILFVGVNRFWSSVSSLDETQMMIKQLNTVQEQEQNFIKMLKLSNQLKMVISRKILQIN